MTWVTRHVVVLIAVTDRQTDRHPLGAAPEIRHMVLINIAHKQL